MKVRHVVRQFAPALGGLESVVLNLSTHQRALGCDASVVTLDRVFSPWSPPLPAADTIAGVPVIRLPFAGSRRYPLAPTVLAHLGDADIVHVHWTDFFFEFLAWTKALHRKRLVATTHGGFFHTERSARFKRLYFATMTRAALLSYDRIVACSEADAERFSKIARRRTVTIENGVAFPQFAGKGSPVLTRTIAYFGRLSSNKRIATLFPLLRELRCLSPEWRLIIAGGDFDITAEALRADAGRWEVAPFVSFHPHPSEDELGNILGGASYFASPSAFEGFGITAVEAMAAGLVPILSDIPPFRKLVERTKLGIIIDPDARRTARNIEAFHHRLADPAAARSRLMSVARTYDWSVVADNYVAQYRQVLGSRGR